MHIVFIMERYPQYGEVSIVCILHSLWKSVHSMHGEVSRVWRGVHSMHSAFIMERCPQYGKVSILCKDVRIMQRCLK